MDTIAELLRRERAAEAFRARYGVTDAWEDEQIEQALEEHRLPMLALLPDTPQGKLLELLEEDERTKDWSSTERHQWRRMNGMHLLAHVMVHEGQRCSGCRDWGA